VKLLNKGQSLALIPLKQGHPHTSPSYIFMEGPFLEKAYDGQKDYCGLYAPKFLSGASTLIDLSRFLSPMNFKVFSSLQDWAVFFKSKYLCALTGQLSSLGRNIFKKNLNPGPAFSDDFYFIKDQIHRGVLNKGVVVDSRVIHSATPATQAEIFSDLLFLQIDRILNEKSEHNVRAQGHLGDFYFLFDFSKSLGLMGCSPEYLFWASGAEELLNFSTMALAGTRNRNSDPLGFLSDSKESYEHDLVVQDLRDKIKNAGWFESAQSIQQGEREILYLRHLMHLMTSLRLSFQTELHPSTFLEFVKILHPTSALGLSPRLSANLGILEKMKSSKNRKYFGSPLTLYLKQNDQVLASSLVAIRNFEWMSNFEDARILDLCLSTGCGVVGESQLEKESQEITLKRIATIKGLLCL
jgi:hypothetical protein